MTSWEPWLSGAEPGSTQARSRLAHQKIVLAQVESGLGACLLAGGRYAEAESLLIRSYRTNKDSITRTAPTLARMIRPYQRIQKPEKVAELASELEQEGQEIPILTFAEVPVIEGKSDAMKRALLITMGTFPGSRLVQ